jgi:hypothetical protein
LTAEPAIAAAVQPHRDLIMQETLTTTLTITEGPTLSVTVTP